MANATYDYANQPVTQDAEWSGGYQPARRWEGVGSQLGLPLAGIAALGLGALAWYYFGPDLRRYLKLRSM